MKITMISQLVRRYYPLIVGSLILVFGAALTTTEAFESNVVLAIAGFALSIVGYRISQRNGHSSPEVDPSTHWSTQETVLRYIVALSGIALFGYGGTTGAQTIISLSVKGALIAGFGMVGGYFVMHVALNNAVL